MALSFGLWYAENDWAINTVYGTLPDVATRANPGILTSVPTGIDRQPGVIDE